MSEQSAGARRAAAAVELMPMIGFQDVLRRSAQFFRPRLPVGDPLAETVKQIEQNPAYAQSRLLTRILTALTYQEGEFRRAEASSLDSETLFLVIKLMDACAAGAHTREEWIRAVDAARAAELGAGG
jgi:hypothetical protein